MITKIFLSFYLIIFIAVLSLTSTTEAQNNTGSPYYIDPHRGEKIYRKWGIIQANQVQSAFSNWGTFGSRDPVYYIYSAVWPNGTFHAHLDEMTIMVAGEVVGTDGNTYHVVSESYSESPNVAPDGHEYWWNPLPGYANDHRHFVGPDGNVDTTTFIAHSADPTTWPSSWPGRDATWNGTWNGYFGQNQFNADDEAYYVMDDSWVNKFPYYPFPDDTTKGGLGLQCETRLFEWANPLAQDMAFIHFRITNISPTGYTRFLNNRPILFGAYADVNPGGLGATNDVDSYDKGQNMVITYAYQNKGVWTQYTNILPGNMAWKFLESPGISDDQVDNDNDGMVDESRENSAETWATYPQYHGPIYEASSPYATKLQQLYGVPPVPDGGVKAAFIATHDTAKFMKYFNLVSLDQIPAIRYKFWWPGDENGNWDPTIDDVGKDGIGPGDPNYKGPDADGTEGNLRPDQGEPDFGILDKDESDQIGLTSFSAPAYGSVTASNENQMWAQMQPGYFANPFGNLNLLWIFSSGPFDLNPLQTERFSNVWIFGPDLQTIYRNAITAQNIYNYNYRFTKPPLQPIVHAVAGDHKVTLYWDNRAENSISPVYGHNFEGYMVVRGTDPQLTEAKVISDALGDWTYYKPIAQFDLKDGVKGMSPIASGSELGGQYNKGIEFYLGNDTGIQYSFTDTTVTNGMTYYYAVLAYDRGYFPGMDTILNDHGYSWVTGGVDRDLVPIEPSFSPFSFTFDINSNLTAKSSNTAIVIPNPRASNYVAGHTDADANGYIKQISGSPTTGKVQVQIVDPGVIHSGYKYQINFVDTPDQNLVRHTTSYSIKNITRDSVVADKTVPLDSTGKPSQTWLSTVFDGMYLNFYNVTPNLDSINYNSGWSINSQTNLGVTIAQGGQVAIGMNFTVKITSQPASNPINITGQPTEYFTILDNSSGDTLQYIFSDANADHKISDKDAIKIVLPKPGGGIVGAWTLKFAAPSGVTAINPQPGDEFDFVSSTPFGTNDVFQFNTFADTTKPVAQNSLDQISVVPNPYIVAAKWELPTSLQGRGVQKLEFNHLPAKCTIRIFTQNGYLIKTIEHNGNVANGSEPWDLTTKDGLNVAFGVYIYHVDAPGIGQKTGLFAVIQ